MVVHFPSVRSLVFLASSAAAAYPPSSTGSSWAATAPMPFGRSDETATAMGSVIYLAGGCNGAQNCAGYCSCSSYTADVQVFDTIANTYTVAPPMPVPRYRHIACAVADTIYFFGGRTQDTDSIITRIDAFNTTAQTWSTLTSQYPADLGSDNSCTTMGSVVYISGGYNSDYSVSWNTTYAFSPSAAPGGNWTRLRGQMVWGRGDFSSVGLNGLIHVYGGYTVADFCAPIPTHEVYNPLNDSWYALASMWDNIAEKDDGLAIGGLIYSFGGEKKKVLSGCSDTDITPVTDVMSFDPATNAWANVTLLPDPRMRFAAAAVGSTVWLFGGQGPVVDGNMIPILTSTYCFFVYGNPAGTGTPSATTFTKGDIAGAVLGTFFATVAVAAGVAIVLVRRGWGARKMPLTGDSV